MAEYRYIARAPWQFVQLTDTQHTKDTLEAGSGSAECPAPRTRILTDRNNLRWTWTRVQMPC